MEHDQDQLVTQLATQTDHFNNLSERLENWCDLITTANHDRLAESITSNEMRQILDSVLASRASLLWIKHQSRSLKEQPVQNEFVAAAKRLAMANAKLRILVQRGLLFTQTMLNAMTANLTANSVYDEHAQSTLAPGNGWRRQA
ncbi:MAG TPA: hypothetical protein VFC63_29020 [Blastocatellia bacterium]|nr:hypothetical protein [Blastocatellia bacterium]